MIIAGESSEVKPPPELDHVLGRLRQYSQSSDLKLARPPQRLRGGFWAEIWALSFAEPFGSLPAKVVLRLAPDSAAATREAIVQNGVAAQGFSTPRIHLAEPATDELRAWSVMDFAPGKSMLADLNGLRLVGALPRIATGLPDTLARVASTLHSLDPDGIEASLNDLVPGWAGVEGLVSHYVDRVKKLDDEPLRRTVERVAATQPKSSLKVICHGDLHPFNVLTKGDHTVVLDWTAARIGHPAYDLSFTHLLLSNAPLHVPSALRPAINAVARRVAKRFVVTYCAFNSFEIDNEIFEWYTSLHACRILIDVASWRASGLLEIHRGHPWFTMQPAVRSLMAAAHD